MIMDREDEAYPNCGCNVLGYEKIAGEQRRHRLAHFKVPMAERVSRNILIVLQAVTRTQCTNQI